MAKTFDLKIKELTQEKSELDLSVLEGKKVEYEKRMCEILEKVSDETSAFTDLNEIKKYYSNIKEIDEKIRKNSEFLKNIDQKISFYQERKDRVKTIPLYKDTEEGIAKIIGDDPLYQYAKETNNEELVKKIEKRSITADEYSDYLEDMYNNLFRQDEGSKISEIPQKNTILLPEGMSEQIKEELGKSKNITPQEIESFLKKELKKNAGEIKLSHIKNTFKNKENQAREYIRRLIINYPGFKIIDNGENKISSAPIQSKREKLISSVSSSETQEEKDSKQKENQLLLQILNIGKINDLDERISIYVDIYEKLGCKFADKEDFSKTLKEMINTYTHIQLEREIQKILTGIINDNIYPIKTEKYGYFAYKFSRSCDNWRIVLYPNGEIFRLCSHNDYEKTISTQPPIDKK